MPWPEASAAATTAPSGASSPPSSIVASASSEPRAAAVRSTARRRRYRRWAALRWSRLHSTQRFGSCPTSATGRTGSPQPRHGCAERWPIPVMQTSVGTGTAQRLPSLRKRASASELPAQHAPTVAKVPPSMTDDCCNGVKTLIGATTMRGRTGTATPTARRRLAAASKRGDQRSQGLLCRPHQPACRPPSRPASRTHLLPTEPTRTPAPRAEICATGAVAAGSTGGIHLPPTSARTDPTVSRKGVTPTHLTSAAPYGGRCRCGCAAGPTRAFREAVAR